MASYSDTSREGSSPRLSKALHPKGLRIAAEDFHHRLPKAKLSFMWCQGGCGVAGWERSHHDLLILPVTTLVSLLQAASRSKSAPPGIALQGCHAMCLVRNGPLLPAECSYPNCCEGDWLTYPICVGCVRNSSWLFCESISYVELLGTKSYLAQVRVVWIQLYRQAVGGHLLYMSSIISIELNRSHKFEHT